MKTKRANKGPADTGEVMARFSEHLKASVERDVQQGAYRDLVQATASLVREWAFWRWLGRRSSFIPEEAYHGVMVRADGRIQDVAALTVAAAYGRVVRAYPARQWPNVGKTPKGWMKFYRDTTAQAKTQNIFKLVEGGWKRDHA